MIYARARCRLVDSWGSQRLEPRLYTKGALGPDEIVGSELAKPVLRTLYRCHHQKYADRPDVQNSRDLIIGMVNTRKHAKPRCVALRLRRDCRARHLYSTIQQRRV
jgi:hypothetical protein